MNAQYQIYIHVKSIFFHASSRKKLPWFANAPYSLKMIVHEADMVIANYDGTRQAWWEKPSYPQMWKLKIKKKEKKKIQSKTLPWQ